MENIHGDAKIFHCEKCDKNIYFTHVDKGWQCVDCETVVADMFSMKTNRMLPIQSKGVLKK